MGNMTPLAEWHCPPDLLDSDRRHVMYPYEKTFCVARDPLARLASGDLHTKRTLFGESLSLDSLLFQS